MFLFAWDGFEEDSLVGGRQLKAGAAFWAGRVCSNCGLNFQLRFGVGTRICPLLKGPVLTQHQWDSLMNSAVWLKALRRKTSPPKAAFLNLLPQRFEGKVAK